LVGVLVIATNMGKSAHVHTGRSVVYSKEGGAAASQPLAVSAAISILKSGGSFIDAAIALSAVICVVEPGASHLGGDAFLITHHAKTRENLAFNGSGEAPHLATVEAYAQGIPLHGFKSATAPGLVSTWFAAHERYGKLSFPELLKPAIYYAENGFAATPGFIKRIANHLALTPTTSIFKDMGIDSHCKVGDLIIQRNLAASLRAIAQGGRAAFYEGEIARKLVDGSDGWFNEDDLKGHSTRVQAPLAINYRDFTIYGQPPPTQGMILMEELLLCERFDFSALSEAERIHISVESKKIGFNDRNLILGDPEFLEVNVERILSPKNIDHGVTQINLQEANNENPAVTEGSDTTYFLVADKEGNAVSWIQSVFHGFGSSWIIPGTGIVLNNRLTGFSLNPDSPNCIQPGKRPAHTLNAWTATRADGSLYLVGGTPGANIQVQTNLQLIINVVDLKMNVQEAIEAPRWQHLSVAGQSSLEETGSGTLEIESRVDSRTIELLRAKGHEVSVIGDWAHGSSVQMLEVMPNGTYMFGSDPRSEGHAAGL